MSPKMSRLRAELDKLDQVEVRLLYLDKCGIDCQDAFASVTYWRNIVQEQICKLPL